LFVRNIATLLLSSEQMSNPISFEQHGMAAVIRFISPQTRNPLSVGVLTALRSAITTVATTKTVKALILTGSDGVFAAGADLREVSRLTGKDVSEFAALGQNLMQSIEDLKIPTIAAVNGPCFGGALDLALACVRRIASANAVFCHPGADLGIMTGWGGTQRLPRLVGEAFALEMFLAAKRVTANEALSKGLIDEIANDPLAAALKVVQG
jgi:enoyl-CoA hydratase/carnithine racemase